ncbi:MAG: ABC transporter ATP-binding protein [Methanospirillum sp.]|uniref:ABC transporter ATP-binding protein n=1 Tax=Methanospirillum sp. TaxID=45200 RepID=UPI0023713CC4|nr:ABC transporter ATP-binding protein [Methanospirillum sp.]MDD1728537.1 ABC transporter ATP-binding protein [Methanospirillum sp.]
MNGEQQVLTVQDLSVKYGSTQVLNSVSFDLVPGEVICIIGPNGSGKSTLIKTLAGIISQKSGNIILNGKNISEYSKNAVAKTIGYVPQDFQYLTSASVLEAVILGRRPHVEWSLTEHDLVVVQGAMDRLAISHMAEKMLTELSGGERQRVFIARAIAQEPQIFLFDEPTSALDIRHQIDVFTMIRELSEQNNKSVLVAVHDLNFAYHYADRVMLVDNGDIVAIGTADEVMTEENIISVYGVPMQFITTEAGRYVLPIWDSAAPKVSSG